MKSQTHVVQQAYGDLKQVAKYLGVSTKQVRRLISRGLPVYRFSPKGRPRGRFQEIDQWMDRNCKVVNELDQIVDEIVEGMK